MILITGVAGYIGSHCAIKLLENNFKIFGYDNLSTGHLETIETIKNFKDFQFIIGDILNSNKLDEIFKNNDIQAVIHLAGLSQVEESIKNPKKYHQNNYEGTKNLLDCMVKNNVKKIIFSSTASIYGEPCYLPIDENHPKNPINTYGKTKLDTENLLDEYDKKYKIKSIRLRYFNVIGADSKIRMGEKHIPETHLLPIILNTALNSDKSFNIYGNNHNTQDGTCIRDYIDVEDIAWAHILAYEYLLKHNTSNVFNLGGNKGISVMEIFNLCKKITNKKIDFKIYPKREGDPSLLVANNSKAKKILNWEPKIPIEESIKKAFLWEVKMKEEK